MGTGNNSARGRGIVARAGGAKKVKTIFRVPAIVYKEQGLRQNGGRVELNQKMLVRGHLRCGDIPPVTTDAVVTIHRDIVPKRYLRGCSVYVRGGHGLEPELRRLFGGGRSRVSSRASQRHDPVASLQSL